MIYNDIHHHPYVHAQGMMYNMFIYNIDCYNYVALHYCVKIFFLLLVIASDILKSTHTHIYMYMTIVAYL